MKVDFSKLARAPKDAVETFTSSELGGEVSLRLLTAGEKIELSFLPPSQFPVEVLARTILGEGAADWVRDAPSSMAGEILELAAKAMQLNGLTKTASEERVKNSP